MTLLRILPGDPADGAAAPKATTRCLSRSARPNRRSGPARVPAPWFVHDDRGSVTPLVIGMLVCLLCLTAGVTAAG